MTDVISVAVAPESIPADSTTESTITATLTDGTNPILTSTNLTFAVTPALGCTLLSSTADTSTTDGTASVNVTTYLPGNYTITVSETADATVKDTGSLKAVPVYTLNVAPSTSLIDNLGGSIELTATVLDFTTGKPVQNVEVDWSVDAGGLYVALSAATSTTDEKGEAKCIATCAGQGVLGSITAKIGVLTAASCNVFFSAPTVPAVSVLNANDDHSLDAAEIALGVEAYIPDPNKGPYEGGDSITLYWGKGSQVVDSKQFPLSGTTQFPIPVDISALFNPDCLLNGDYDVFYVFTDRFLNTHCSQNFPLTVNGVTPPDELPAPTFPEATNNTINANVAAGGINMRIRYAGMATTDNVNIYWQEYTTNGNPVAGSTYTTTFSPTANDVKLGFHDELIPQDSITAVKTNGTAQGSYKVERGDGTTLSSATGIVDVILY